MISFAIALGCKPLQTIHITDQEPLLSLMIKNIEINNLTDKVKASIYNWGEDLLSSSSSSPSLTKELPRQPDILLAADCVYFEPAFPLLQKTMLDLIGDNTVCYFCFKKRRRADLHFIKTCRKLFNIELIKDDPEQLIYSKENIYLYVELYIYYIINQLIIIIINIDIVLQKNTNVILIVQQHQRCISHVIIVQNLNVLHQPDLTLYLYRQDLV